MSSTTLTNKRNTVIWTKPNLYLIQQAIQLLNSLEIKQDQLTFAENRWLFCTCRATRLEDNSEQMRVSLAIRSNEQPCMDWSSVEIRLLPDGDKSQSAPVVAQLEANGQWHQTIPADNYQIEAQSRQSYNISLLAAASERLRTFCYDTVGGDWSLTRYRQPDLPQFDRLMFKCHDEQIAAYEGMQVIITVGDQTFDLGIVDDWGKAAIDVPFDLTLPQSGIKVELQCAKRNHS